MAQYTFHVLHNARPEYELSILAILRDGIELDYERMLSIGRDAGLPVGSQVKTERQLKDILQPLRDLGMIERRNIRLTTLGRAIAYLAEQKPDLFAEVFHYLYYSAWEEKNAAENCFSWTYRYVCDNLWQQMAMVIDKKALVSGIASSASQQFQSTNISVSVNSINGVLIWLDALKPAVLRHENGGQQDIFVRRPFCPPELFVLGVNYVYRQNGLDYGTNLLLSDDRRDEICKVCLLDTANFDRVLEYAITQFGFFEKGLGGGWGRYLTLRRAPEVEDF